MKHEMSATRRHSLTGYSRGRNNYHCEHTSLRDSPLVRHRLISFRQASSPIWLECGRAKRKATPGSTAFSTLPVLLCSHDLIVNSTLFRGPWTNSLSVTRKGRYIGGLTPA